LVALTQEARTALDAASLAALRANQAADDVRDAIGTLARLRSQNSPRVAAAQALADAALEAQRQATETARLAAETALQAVNAADAAAVALANLAIGTVGEASAIAARDAINLAGLTLGNAISFAITAASHAVAAAASGAIVLVIHAVGQVVAPVFDFFLGGDFVLTNTAQFLCEPNMTPPPAFPPGARQPPGTCFRMGDAPNRPTGLLVRDQNPAHSAALISRHVPTHEYGHYVLCNIMERQNPIQFAAAYNEAAADGIIGQTPDKQHVVFNEAFADLITAQVAGGLDYSTTVTSLIPARDMAGNIPAELGTNFQHFCPVGAVHGCVEQNLTGFVPGDANDDFREAVGRMVTLFNDAFDGACQPGPGVANNGKPWTEVNQRVFFSGFGPPGFTNEEVILLPGFDLPRWIQTGMRMGPLLREDNMFAGLNAVMVERGFTFCQRCELFRLHQQTNDCPAEWVGTPPPGTVCVDEDPAECDECLLGSCTTDADCGPTDGCDEVTGCCVIG
jgi:hypothetical protein